MIKIRDNQLIATPPVTTANVLYLGQIKLGSPPIDYGILFDLEGKRKQLWVDCNGTGDYSGQTPQTLSPSEPDPDVNVYYSEKTRCQPILIGPSPRSLTFCNGWLPVMVLQPSKLT